MERDIHRGAAGRVVRWAAASVAAVGLALMGGCATPNSQVATNYFYVGGKYAGTGAQRRLEGHMYVQVFEPAVKRHPWPVVMVHGNSQSGNNYTGTIDGRPGWAQDFAARGFTVYVVDQVGRARSGTFPARYGEYGEPAMSLVELLARAPDTTFPTARLNTQWPDKGVAGEPYFDQFMAQQMPSIRDVVKIEELNLAAHLALLDKIGPAILIEHSQAGVFGWKVADTRPDLVKALVAIEPNGPPFYNLDLPYQNAPAPAGTPWYRYTNNLLRPWGLTRLPLTFAPPTDTPPASLLQAQADGPDRVPCYLQAGTPRTLPQLAKVKIALITAEASFRTASDHCNAAFLRQAGVPLDHIRLADIGVRGNGHMMMLEKNSSEVAGVIMQWLERKGM
jgi:pimeloyl-ACP methyl ester carboxylesterase